jgi:hypothetical protein
VSVYFRSSNNVDTILVVETTSAFICLEVTPKELKMQRLTGFGNKNSEGIGVGFQVLTAVVMKYILLPASCWLLAWLTLRP